MAALDDARDVSAKGSIVCHAPDFPRGDMRTDQKKKEAKNIFHLICHRSKNHGRHRHCRVLECPLLSVCAILISSRAVAITLCGSTARARVAIDGELPEKDNVCEQGTK